MTPHQCTQEAKINDILSPTTNSIEQVLDLFKQDIMSLRTNTYIENNAWKMLRTKKWVVVLCKNIFNFI